MLRPWVAAWIEEIVLTSGLAAHTGDSDLMQWRAGWRLHTLRCPVGGINPPSVK